jgi:hypothetical protein
MGGFYNDKLKCFQHSATANLRVSISSTCLGISAMFKVCFFHFADSFSFLRLLRTTPVSTSQNSDLWAGYAGPSSNSQFCLPEIREALSGNSLSRPIVPHPEYACLTWVAWRRRPLAKGATVCPAPPADHDAPRTAGRQRNHDLGEASAVRPRARSGLTPPAQTLAQTVLLLGTTVGIDTAKLPRSVALCVPSVLMSDPACQSMHPAPALRA